MGSSSQVPVVGFLFYDFPEKNSFAQTLDMKIGNYLSTMKNKTVIASTIAIALNVSENRVQITRIIVIITRPPDVCKVFRLKE